MRLTILGCNGTYPTPGRPSSGYLIQTDAVTLWLDCGTGTFAAIQDHIDPTSIDAIIISHEHVDHCVDVLPFAYARRYGHPVLPAVPVYAPGSVRERLEALIGRKGSAVFEALDFHPVDDSTQIRLGDLRVSFFTSNHPVPTVAVRIASGQRTFVYTADTGVAEGMGAWAEGADVLLAEASYLGAPQDKPWPHHLTASEAGELAVNSNASQLVLTHLWPTNDPALSTKEASAVFTGPVIAATPGLIIELEERHVPT